MSSARDTSSSSSTASAAGHYHAPRKSGHLYKRTGLAKSWKTRFFSLEGSVLYYYKREGDTVPKGIVMLTGCELKTTRDKKYYSFRISHPKTSKVYDLAATLQSRTEDWMEALREAAQPLHSQPPVTTPVKENRSESIAILEDMPMPKLSTFTMDEADMQLIVADDAELPSEYAEEMEALMCEFVAQARDDADGWKLQAEQRDCKVYTRAASRMGSCKGVGFINHHPYLIMKLLLDLSRRDSFDPQLLSARRPYVYDDHTFIDHLTYKPVFPASAREMVHITHWRVLQNGSILLIATSVDREDLCPLKEPKVVRGHTVMGGFLITPNSDYTGAYAQYIVKADLKVGIPSALQTKLFTKQAYVIDGVRRALDEDDLAGAQDLPRVTNNTFFGVSPSDGDDLPEELHSSRSVSTNDDYDTGDESNPKQSFGTIPAEGFPSVPSKYREMIDKAIARMKVDMDDETAWNFHSEKHGVKAYTKVDGSLTAAKGVGRLPYHPRAVWDLVLDVERKKTIDSGLAHGMRLANLDAQTYIDYNEFKPVFVVSGRDFCTLVHWRVQPGGTIIIVAQSIEDLELCPLKEPKVVRADCHISAWRIVPDADYKYCDVTYMVKTDLKGNIPSRITAKVASDQPYLIYHVAQALKKSKDLDRYAAQGRVTNTILDKAGSIALARASMSIPTTRGSVSTKPRSKTTAATISVKNGHVEPEPEAVAVKTKLADEQKDDGPKHAGETSTQNFIILNAVQFVLAIVALKVVSLPGVLHYGVVGYLAVYFLTMLYMGPNHMTPRRKLMIASFGPPDSGMILGTLSLDVTKTQKYIEEKRQKTGDHITITHIVLRALGSALAKTPSVNGHLVFGNYYPAPTVDISCLVAVAGGKDLGVCRLTSCDKMTLKEVCARVRGDATKLRSGKDKEQDDRNKLMSILPTWVIRPVVNLVGWLGGCLGLRIKPVGVEPYMFGSCMVTSVGMMGLELAFAPITPYAQTPMLITIGAIRDTPVVVDGQLAVRPILTLTTTIDHRYVDGSQAARMANWMKQCVEDPTLMEPVDV